MELKDYWSYIYESIHIIKIECLFVSIVFTSDAKH